MRTAQAALIQKNLEPTICICRAIFGAQIFGAQIFGDQPSQNQSSANMSQWWRQKAMIDQKEVLSMVVAIALNKQDRTLLA